MGKFVLRVATNGQYYWVFKSANNEIICVTETYLSRDAALHSIDVVKRLAASADIYE